MFENFQRWFALQQLRRHYRKQGDETLSFSRAVANVRQILICIPLNPDEFRVARYVLKFLASEDENHSITFILPEDYMNTLPHRSHDRLIPIRETARDKLGRFLPELMEKVLDRDYQAAADLNTRFDFGTSLLCRKTNAPLRIGFASDDADIFFNIEIQKPEDKFLLEGAYRSIQRLLAIDNKS